MIPTILTISHIGTLSLFKNVQVKAVGQVNTKNMLKMIGTFF